MVGIFPLSGIFSARIKDKNIFMAKEPQYKLRAMVHSLSQPRPWAGVEPQSRSDSRSVCGEGIQGHPLLMLLRAGRRCCLGLVLLSSAPVAQTLSRLKGGSTGKCRIGL